MLLWTALLLGFLLWTSNSIDNEMLGLARQEAISNFNKDKVFREWSTMHGGVYVFESGFTPDIPWLSHLPDQYIETPDGRRLALINPASMLRQMMDQYSDLYGVKGRITSEAPLNPNNAPDDWELAALQSFQAGSKEKTAILDVGGKPFFRLIRPMQVIPGCLKCHGHQEGYIVGKTKGGVGVSIPLTGYLSLASARKQTLWFIFIPIWITGLVLIWRDYSKSRLRVIDRVRSQEVLIEAHDREKKAHQAKDEFLASMSHELRTPLASILGHCEILEEEAVNAEQRYCLKQIHLAGETQLALVNDILDISRIESGKFVINEAPYSLRELLDEVKGMAFIQSGKEHIQLFIKQNNQENHLLLGDEQHIKQILLNLLGNAYKFTSEGSITLNTDIVDGMLHFAVTDTGIGIKPENMEKLFMRFEQEDSSISRRFGGSGLGLFISRYLAYEMGGSLSATSQLGKGSTFFLLLPYQPTEIEDKPVQETAFDADVNHFHGHVLLAEGTPALQILIRRMLEKYGLTVTVVENGQQATQQVADNQFDLIFMDTQMTVMNGVEATKKIRRSGVSTPIYALTANVMQQHSDLFQQAGSNGFLAKPIDKGKLNEVLISHLTKRDAASVDRFMDTKQDEEAVRLLVIDDEKTVLDMYEYMLTENTCERDELDEYAATLERSGPDGEANESGQDIPEDSPSTESYPIELTKAMNGKEGYHLFELALSEGKPFTVVIMDIVMPGWDGIEVAEKIRTIDSEVKIIFVTAHMQSLSNLRKRIKLGFDFLYKPINREELYQLVLSNADSWLKNRELVNAYNQLKRRKNAANLLPH